MSVQWVAADLHLGHVGVTKFLKDDGSKLRPWDTIEEMDETIIQIWNTHVRPQDKVYILGDAVINRKHLHKIGRLNGQKKLIYGNHDTFKLAEYQQYFYEVAGYKVLKDMILSHIPLHTSQLNRFSANVHGHLHSNIIDDPRYLCVSLEQTEFRPITLDECRTRIELNKQLFEKKRTLK